MTETTAPNLLLPENISFAAFWGKWIGAGPAALQYAMLTSLAALLVAGVVWWRRQQNGRDAYLEVSLLLLLMPLISPQYFERHWPRHYAERRIWYVGFVAVKAGAPVTTFAQLIAAMHETSTCDAITALDVCARTDAVRHLPRSVRVLLHRLSGNVRMHKLDEQSYWLYEFPRAAAQAGPASSPAAAV